MIRETEGFEKLDGKVAEEAGGGYIDGTTPGPGYDIIDDKTFLPVAHALGKREAIKYCEEHGLSTEILR